jgi:glycosyltransferase involved in cell wall biosynthesis
MRIAQVAPPVERVPPTAYGGTERVVSTLTEALVRRGHDVTLFASGDSVTSARLVPTVDRALWHDSDAADDFLPFWAITLGKLASRLADFDVVHNHLDFLAYPLSRLSGRPIVTTLHGRLDMPSLAPLYSEFEEAPLVSISDAQRQPLPWANWLATVYNGIDLDEFTCGTEPGDYLAYVGRISPEKGLDIAIRVAHATGRPLKIAARLPLPAREDREVSSDWSYYEEVIRPLLARPEVEFPGELGDAAKAELLAGAAALLFPVRWPEPFGLVMAEALAAGTPVLALRHGSVPEVIDHGVTGFVCDDEDALVEAVGRLDQLDRAQCRHEAERRFSPTAMASAYERVYTQAVYEHETPWNGSAGIAVRPRPESSADASAPGTGVTWRIPAAQYGPVAALAPRSRPHPAGSAR